MKKLAEMKHISYSTFTKYANPNNRRVIGGRAGRKSVVTEANYNILLSSVVGIHEAMGPMSNEELIILVLRVQPGLTRQQAKNFVNHTLLKRLRSMETPPVFASNVKTNVSRSQNTRD